VDRLRIGIPRALLYYYYYPFWKTFFEELGHEVVITKETNKELINEGIKISVPEICVPIKIYVGHVLALLQDDVDYIFVPRMVSIHPGETFCPKFLGLPDMLRAIIPELENKMLTVKINSKDDLINNYHDYHEIAEPLNVTGYQIKRALKAAEKTWNRFRVLCKQGLFAPEAINMAVNPQQEIPRSKQEMQESELVIGLIGYVYDIYDSFVSLNITEKLQAMGVKIITFEMLDNKLIMNEIKPFRKTLFWTFSNKLLGAGYYFYKQPSIDGLIQVTAFGCGPDSLLGKLLELESDRYGKPFMTVRVDEHTGANHLDTRIEAFVDMLKKKKMKLKQREVGS